MVTLNQNGDWERASRAGLDKTVNLEFAAPSCVVSIVFGKPEDPNSPATRIAFASAVTCGV